MTSIAAWGKLPGHGDFLRIGSDSAPVAAFDAAFTALRLDAAQAEIFAVGGPVVAFIRQADRWWGAVVLPSTDRVGRHAPFVAVAGIRSVDPADEIGVLPLAFAVSTATCSSTSSSTSTVGPRLSGQLGHPGQLPQVVGVAQAVQGLVVLAVDHQAVVDRDAPEVGQDPGGVHRDPASLAVQVEQRPGVVAGGASSSTVNGSHW